MYSLGADDVFAYIVTNAGLPGYLIQRRDGSLQAHRPWPKGIDPANPFKNGLFFGDNGAGDVFYDRDIDGRIVGHHTRDAIDVDLGIRPRFLAWVDSKRLVTCGNDGVRVVFADGVTPELVLDDEICKAQLLGVSGGYVYYDVGTTVRKAKLDGKEAPQTLFDFGEARVLTIATPGDSIVYSYDPADRYVHGAGDGWLANWKFMERGLDATFSSDRQKLYWLEHAAQGSATGDFMTVKLPGPGLPGGTADDAGQEHAPVLLPRATGASSPTRTAPTTACGTASSSSTKRAGTSSTWSTAPTTSRRFRIRTTTSSTWSPARPGTTWRACRCRRSIRRRRRANDLVLASAVRCRTRSPTADVRQTATLARLELSDEEVARMTRELDAILGYMELLDKLDVSSVPPMTHAVSLDLPLRDDVVEALEPQLPVAAALSDAPRAHDAFFEVPKIIEVAER